MLELWIVAAQSSELGTFIASLPPLLQWLIGLGMAIGAAVFVARGYSRGYTAPAPQATATIEAAIAEPAAQKRANELLADILVETRSVRIAADNIARRMEDEAEAREAFEKAEFYTRIKALETATSKDRRSRE